VTCDAMDDVGDDDDATVLLFASCDVVVMRVMREGTDMRFVLLLL